MNSLRSVLNRLSDSDFEIAKSNQSIYSSPYESIESIEAGKSYISSLNKDMDVICPVMCKYLSDKRLFRSLYIDVSK